MIIKEIIPQLHIMGLHNVIFPYSIFRIPNMFEDLSNATRIVS